MNRLLLAVFLVLTAILPAAAETAEEAVAYAVLGLADAASLTRGPTTMKWTESAASPAVFDGDTVLKGRPARLKFTVTAVDPCDYDITVEGPPNIIPGGTRLFARVALARLTGITIRADGFKAAAEGDGGYCETGDHNSRCMGMEEHDLLGPIDAVKHKAALDFLRAEICPANPAG